MVGETRTAGIIVVAAAAVLTVCPLLAPPWSAADPASPTTTTTSTQAPAGFPSDAYGYVDTAARCDEGQTLMLFGRTARALVAVCVGPDGQLEYRGVRLSDRAEIAVGAGRSADGAVIANNGAVTYSISPGAFLVSEDGDVLYRDTWEEFHQPRFPATPTSAAPSSATPAPSTATSSSAPAAPTTVSTTTVTPPPRKAAAGG